MAAEDIGGVYTTKQPGYDDTADIQAALKLFLYGSEGTPPATKNLVSGGIALHIRDLDTRVGTQESIGIGSDYYPSITEQLDILTEITSPVDGQIAMVNLNNGSAVETMYASVTFTNEAPTENLISGMLWVDKDSEALDTYVYDATLLPGDPWVKINDLKNIIQAKGDILIGSSAENIDNLSVGANGTVLTADNSSPLGVKWQQVDTESIIISSVMGAY